MTDEQKTRVKKAITQLHKLGKWDNIFVDLHDGEPVVYATIERKPLHKFLLDTGLMKKPQIPRQLEGVRCEVRVHYPAKKR